MLPHHVKATLFVEFQDLLQRLPLHLWHRCQVTKNDFLPRFLKFRAVDPETPKTRGRPPKHYHLLLQKKKDLESTVHRILLKPIADSVRPTGSRLEHLYGLPKTHKERLAMRPILSATQTYNYGLATLLEEKLSYNQYTITDTFEFAD